MKFTGISRPVDSLGRVVIPKEIRRQLDITDGVDSFRMYLNENKEIVLSKYRPCCVFCSSEENLTEFNNQLICNQCIDKLNNLREEQSPV